METGSFDTSSEVAPIGILDGAGVSMGTGSEDVGVVREEEGTEAAEKGEALGSAGFDEDEGLDGRLPETKEELVGVGEFVEYVGEDGEVGGWNGKGIGERLLEPLGMREGGIREFLAEGDGGGAFLDEG